MSILKEATDAAAQALLESERTRLKALIRRHLAEKAMLAEAHEGFSQAFDCKVTSCSLPVQSNLLRCIGAALFGCATCQCCRSKQSTTAWQYS